ncbi:putative alpha-L-rhamnosidase B [Coniochaeta sp. 2T2.1]|nr:putative alpha-L-rhamnosidase B [Coniochaeta sp. 2T2.1]
MTGLKNHFLNWLLLLSTASRALGQSCWRNTSCSDLTKSAFPGPWESNIYAPTSRKVKPKTIIPMTTGIGNIPYSGVQGLVHNASGLVFDFGLEVGGIVTIKYEVSGNFSGAVGLAFSEARNYIGMWSDTSNGGFKGPDGALYSNFTGPGDYAYTMPDGKIRGGFRYLTLFLITDTGEGTHDLVNIYDISLEIGFQPTWSNLRSYQGYFHCNDETLNKIWYSGAYTLQTNAVPPSTGRRAPPSVVRGWDNDGYLGPGDTIIVDGAKRDRAVWPGDMGVAVPSTFVSVGDLDSVRNALQVMYDYQNKDGSFPEAGPPLLQQGSDTYHMWTMIGTHNYMIYKNDTAFLQQNWEKYLKAMDYILGKVTPSSGLLNVTGTRDWARWQTGYNMSEAQMILYQTLLTGADLALWAAGDSTLSQDWTTRASALANATLEHCLDSPYGAFKDNATSTTLHPQDANSLALMFGLVSPTSALGQSISRRLTANWTPIGAETPELPGNISPFISSFEIRAHLAAGQTSRALDLIRRSWGWYLTHPNGTGSTVVEGYRTDGSWGYRSERGYGNDPSYVSHAHGWSSGPTGALTEGVLGLSVTGRLGESWKFAPAFGDLRFARGGFVTGLGKFEAGWERGKDGYQAWVAAPEGTRGQLVLPVLENGRMPKVVVDEKRACGKWYRKGVADDVVDLVVVEAGGGNHTVVVSR